MTLPQQCLLLDSVQVGHRIVHWLLKNWAILNFSVSFLSQYRNFRLNFVACIYFCAMTFSLVNLLAQRVINFVPIKKFRNVKV